MRIGSRTVKNKKRKKPQPQTQMNNYQNYLHSYSWIEKRDRFRAAFSNKCAVCGETENLHIHHLNYDCLGNETINDVVCLCKGCHYKAHRKKLVIWVFTEEEFEHFRAIADIICSDKSITYLALLKRKEGEKP